MTCTTLTASMLTKIVSLRCCKHLQLLAQKSKYIFVKFMRNFSKKYYLKKTSKTKGDCINAHTNIPEMCHTSRVYENKVRDTLALISCGLFPMAFSRQTSFLFFSRVTGFSISIIWNRFVWILGFILIGKFGCFSQKKVLIFSYLNLSLYGYERHIHTPTYICTHIVSGLQHFSRVG